MGGGVGATRTSSTEAAAMQSQRAVEQAQKDAQRAQQEAILAKQKEETEAALQEAIVIVMLKGMGNDATELEPFLPHDFTGQFYGALKTATDGFYYDEIEKLANQAEDRNTPPSILNTTIEDFMYAIVKDYLRTRNVQRVGEDVIDRTGLRNNFQILAYTSMDDVYYNHDKESPLRNLPVLTNDDNAKIIEINSDLLSQRLSSTFKERITEYRSEGKEILQTLD